MGKYDDIIEIPYKNSQKHPPMSNESRAAQFASFAALSGYEDEVAETGRFTNEKINLDENEIQEINEKLMFIQQYPHEEHTIRITYFKPDKSKKGGKYITSESFIKKINIYDRTLTVSDGTVIPIDSIYDLSGDIFDFFE